MRTQKKDKKATETKKHMTKKWTKKLQNDKNPGQMLKQNGKRKMQGTKSD